MLTIAAALVAALAAPPPGSASGFFEGGAVEEGFQEQALPELVIEGGFFSLDIVGHDGNTVAGRAVMSSRVRSRNDVRLSLLNVTPVASAKPLQPGEAVAAADPASPPVEQWMLEELGKKEPGFNGAEKRH